MDSPGTGASSDHALLTVYPRLRSLSVATQTSLARRFLTVSVGSLFVILMLAFGLVYFQFNAEFDRAANRERDLLTESQISKGNLLVNLLAKISPEAILGSDLYSLQRYATETLRDDEVVYVHIYDKDGKLLLKEEKDVVGDAEEFSASVQVDKEKFGVEMTAGEVRVGLSNSRRDAAQQQAEAYAGGQRTKMGFQFFATELLAALAMAIALYAVLNRVVLRPLLVISDRIQDIADGEGDLTRRVEVGEHNEIGQLAERFNTFLTWLQGMIKQVASSADTVSDTSDGLASSSGSVSKTTSDVAERSTAVSTATSRATESMQSISANAESMAQSVQSVATSVEEMSASLSEVARNCQKESAIASQANEQSTETREMMNKLGVAAEQINRVVDTINDIADQTNLLALNATIEAASAGDAGKGFAVVANEVKELARQTAQATSEIGGQIQEMQEIANGSIQAIESIARVIEEVNTISQTIVTAVEQQSATINEISGNVGDASSMTTGIARQVQESASSLASVAENIQIVHEGINTAVGGVTTMSSGSRTMKQHAEELKALVARFKV